MYLEWVRRQASEVCRKGQAFAVHVWGCKILAELVDMMIKVVYAILAKSSYRRWEQLEGSLLMKMGPQWVCLELMRYARRPCLRSYWLWRGLPRDV